VSSPPAGHVIAKTPQHILNWNFVLNTVDDFERAFSVRKLGTFFKQEGH